MPPPFYLLLIMFIIVYCKSCVSFLKTCVCNKVPLKFWQFEEPREIKNVDGTFQTLISTPADVKMCNDYSLACPTDISLSLILVPLTVI